MGNSAPNRHPGEQRTTPAKVVAIHPLPKCLVVIPARNEAGVIGQVISRTRALFDYPVLVVDDASEDATIAEARLAGARVVGLVSRLGAWGAIQTGLIYAQAHDFNYVITLDADGQHEPDCLSLLAVHTADADLVIGACESRGSPARHFAWRLLKWVSGLDVDDLTSGLRIYNRRAIESLTGNEASLLQYQDVGVLALLRNRGLTIHSVQVTMLPRRNGKSRIFNSWAAVVYYLFYSLLLSLGKRR